MHEEEFRAEVAAANIGEAYLCPRKSVADERKKRREELLKSAERESFKEPKNV